MASTTGVGKSFVDRSTSRSYSNFFASGANMIVIHLSKTMEFHSPTGTYIRSHLTRWLICHSNR